MFPIFVVLIVVIVIAYYFLNSEPNANEVIEENQKMALLNAKKILKAQERWKKNDYDANGKNDYILGPLKTLSNISFVNGNSISILDIKISNSDYRFKNNRIACDGYYFTVASTSKKWKLEGVEVNDFYIIAIPEKRGVTGSCIFLLNSQNKAYYCSAEYKKLMPTWPSSKELQLKIWKELSL